MKMAIGALYIKGINFRVHKFSRVLHSAGINSRNLVKIRENSRKLIPAKYAKIPNSRKFAKINTRELFAQTHGFAKINTRKNLKYKKRWFRYKKKSCSNLESKDYRSPLQGAGQHQPPGKLLVCRRGHFCWSHTLALLYENRLIGARF